MDAREQATWNKKESKAVEIYGVKGMKSTPFRKVFKSRDALVKWMDSDAAGNCSVYGTREVEGGN